ncbi:hypothetical protein [Streptomyces sp. NPDC058045]|uniref:hypothetical protein n=1 Tax=Streptomyces sp. NPDC058045 TaxID=3346311 RepID=UPI0036EE4CB1
MSHICGLCETDVDAGYLCPGCARATARRLELMPRLYDALAAFLHPAGRRPELGRARPAEAPLPLAETPFSLRGPGGIVGVLEDWRSAMQADRGWGEPVPAGTTERRVVVAARALLMNLEWVVESWPMAGAFAEEIRDLHQAARSIVDPRDPADQPRRLGYCLTELNGESCGAVVLLRSGSTTARCEWCGTDWPPSRWVELAAGQAQFAATGAA